ncbi:MAG: hypothetical protein ACKN9U_14250, partial [Pirellulaceae bacterium]
SDPVADFAQQVARMPSPEIQAPETKDCTMLPDPNQGEKPSDPPMERGDPSVGSMGKRLVGTS